MPEPQAILPLRALPPDAPLPLPPPFHPQTPPSAAAPSTTPNPTPPQPQNSAAAPSSSSSRPPHPWEINARAWLESFPDGHPAHRARGRRLHRRPPPRASISAPLPASTANPRPPRRPDAEQSAFPYRFQRTDLWKPVYQWLESLEMESLVETKQISDWLTSNPKIMDRLVEKHSKYHLIHYTQRMHLKLLKKRGKLPKVDSLVTVQLEFRVAQLAVFKVEVRLLGTRRHRCPKGKKLYSNKNCILTDLQNQLTTVLLKQCRTVAIKETDSSYLEFQNPETKKSSQEGAATASAPAPAETVNVYISEKSNAAGASDSEVGKNRKRNPIIVTPAWSYSEALTGWNSPAVQFEGPAIHVVRKSYLSWSPTSCAYTSNAPSAQPHDRQGVRKVLDVKFHPEGLPQLVSSSNEAPNELLLFNLRSGRAIQLRGHNTKIQSIAFAVKGASVVSCASNLLKVWDCITGSCLYTLGGDDHNLVGHTQKINAMAVNKWQSCLVVTSGAKGDGKLLLWNALRGELASDLNSNLGTTEGLKLSQALCYGHFAITQQVWCADCRHGTPAPLCCLIRLRSQDMVYPSVDTMEFCSENLLACGSDCDYGGSAVVQLWDIESPESYLSFSASDSVTSVSFSNCGLDPLTFALSLSRLIVTFHVDEGDQGVNATQWLHNEPVLVTVSGDGSVGMWDVTLGQPCVRHIVAHTRCANAVAVSPNDDYFSTGGSDQKVLRTSLNQVVEL
ncbi:hypothetical protein PR202_ga21649 [Eleusine coracana subsp. coracana]|uniref:Uncharacterized protein n=1 Tax=Eleusine coracana subsp. coracana TaxID=191504 RepID=A0AAV5D1J1_ELECO|nr:hypothetical protein PR202_ga21649 [Eleusine coracana subsp. coracana]